MRRTKNRVSPSVDVMEPRVLLSTAAPLVVQARVEWSRSRRQGHHEHAGQDGEHRPGECPSHQALVADFDRTGRARPDVAERHRALSPPFHEVDHHDGEADPRRPLRFVQGGVDGGNPPVTGSGPDLPPPRAARPPPGQGTGGTSTPVPVPSLDSVTIQNTTGLALVVTVHLRVPQVQQPWITETIPAQGNSSVSFDFGTATNAFMTMDVSLADGGQTPPPFNNLSLCSRSPATTGHFSRSRYLVPTSTSPRSDPRPPLRSFPRVRHQAGATRNWMALFLMAPRRPGE